MVALIALVGGCQTETRTSPVRPGEVVHTAVESPQATQRPVSHVSPDQLVLTDPSAIRLHDIGGAMLFYFAVNKRLPDKLEELRPYADGDVELNFTSPVSQQPYGYAPRGLIFEGRNKRIVAYDPVAHNGKRWCIFMAVARPAEAQSIEVLELQDGVFRLYRPAEE